MEDTKAKRFGSVAKLIRETSGDEEFVKEVESRMKERTLVKRLYSLRIAKGISQEEIARQLGCTQSRISKIENGKDGDLRVQDIEGYARAIGCEALFAMKRRNATIAEDVKLHALAIKNKLHQLADMAGDDETMAEGVAGFFGEAFFNLVRILQEAAPKPPPNPDNERPYLQVDVTAFEMLEEQLRNDVASSKGQASGTGMSVA